MTLTQHIALTGLAAAALAPLVGTEELLLFTAGGVLVDVDHYLLYIQRRRNLSVSGMFRYFRELQPIQTTIPYIGLCIFHTVDFFILIALLALIHPPLNYLLAGCLYHFAIDLIDLRRKQVIFIRPFFLVEHFVRRRTEGYPWY
ncbi:hypothetical protein [Geomonas sp.]|uniref:hypothetical protein n=1 Tax=Geomonas sp. TaxID=2651584 RepID=UPI002B45B1F1|nr:hypothetical protein [Geomonas sp.]HJV33543.1 hypothetical protein [Geomonas sp.]